MTTRALEWTRRPNSLTAPAADSVATAKLAAVPESLRFPAELSDRIWYDNHSQRLFFRGFMSKAMFDRLHGLHPDVSYQRAVQELFRASTERRGKPEGTKSWSWIRAILALAGMAAIVSVISVLWHR